VTTRRVVCRAACRQTWREQRRRSPQAPGAFAPLGGNGDRPGEPTALGNCERPPHPGDGPTRGASGGPGVSTGRWTALFDRWPGGVWHRLAAALWLLESTGTAPSHRPAAQTPLAAPAPAALGAGGEVVPPRTPCESQPPGGLRDDRPGPAGAGGRRWAEPYGLCREAQSGPAPAGGCSRPSGPHALPGRGQLGTASGVVAQLPQLLPAAGQPPLAAGCAGVDPGPWLSAAVAAVYTGDGGGPDGAGLDAA
jgi:hypothetical protein